MDSEKTNEHCPKCGRQLARSGRWTPGTNDGRCWSPIMQVCDGADDNVSGALETLNRLASEAP